MRRRGCQLRRLSAASAVTDTLRNALEDGRASVTLRRRVLFPLDPHLSQPEAVAANGELLTRRSEPEIVLVIDGPRLLD